MLAIQKQFLRNISSYFRKNWLWKSLHNLPGDSHCFLGKDKCSSRSHSAWEQIKSSENYYKLRNLLASCNLTFLKFLDRETPIFMLYLLSFDSVDLTLWNTIPYCWKMLMVLESSVLFQSYDCQNCMLKLLLQNLLWNFNEKELRFEIPFHYFSDNDIWNIYFKILLLKVPVQYVLNCPNLKIMYPNVMFYYMHFVD